MKTRSIYFLLSLVIALMLLDCNRSLSPEHQEASSTTQKEFPTPIADSYENMRNSRLGSFVYFADAAVFTDCSTDESFYVAPFAGDYREEESYYTLETQYLQEVEEPGLLLYIEIEGYHVEEEEEGLGQTIVPVHFNLISQEEADCK